MDAYQYRMPTKVVFGAGAFDSLEEHCAPLGERPLLVTGRRSARATGLLDRALAQLPGAVHFDAVDENPDTSCCEAGAARCKEADCDCIVALGGGSAMDAAKAIALLARNPGACGVYFGTHQFSQGALPIVAAPTTGGAGSEVTPYAVLVDNATNTKRTISGEALFPRIALLDPELTATMPRDVTVATGLDALSQGMEGMLSRRATAVGDVLALEVCRLVARWLPRAAAEPEDLEARARMQHAAMLSGCIIAQSGTTLVHGMGYYFTLEFGVAHGLANALLLAPVFRHNARHAPGKVAAIAEALGCSGPESSAAENIGKGLHALFEALAISPAAKDAGVDAERLRPCAEHICGDSNRFKNQLGSFSVEDVHAIFLDASEGR